MNSAFRFRRLYMAAFAALLFAGCGPRMVKVEGKLLNNGQPYTPPPGAHLSLSFVGSGEGGPTIYPATINPGDSSFTAPGPNGGGVPPGKYKIQLNLAPESTDPASLAKMAAAGNVFTAINGKECEVPDSGAKSLTIDIAKGTVNP